MPNFDQIDIKLLESNNVTVQFFESSENASLLLIKISGKILYGSEGSYDCDFINQRIGISLISSTFTAVLLDLTELKYEFGNSIVDAFMSLSNIKIGAEDYIRAYVLSEKNKFGLSTIWCFDLENPREPIFYDLNTAVEYINNKMNGE